ncbi:MAG TPA: sulfotransferase [Solirubrobacteraceae bacterium]|nr:sulfotransferase [Solirubrobacteraceae bacterium]
MSMRIIGAGLPRTGTLTQKLALERLGFAPCYHWVNVIADLDQVDVWNRALDGEGPWEEVFGGFQSTVDWPGGYFYRELAEAYPDAKVLLSVRDPERWEPSFRETIVEMRYGESLMRLLASARGEIDPRWRRYLELVDRMFYGPQGTFADGWEEPEQLMEQMVAHTEQVKAAIPADRLLVWEVGEGWGPLCEFLGVEVPDEPLPHENDRETFLDRVRFGAIDALAAWKQERTAAAATA